MPNELMRLASSAKSVYCITHLADFDGLASAAMLVHYLGVPVMNVFFGGPDLENMKPSLTELLSVSPKESLVVFTDIPIDSASLDCVLAAIKVLKRSNNRIVWIDHHLWNAAIVAKIRTYCDILICGENRQCATELVLRSLHKNTDNYSKKIGNIAHLVDFNLPITKAKKRTIYAMVSSIAMSNYTRLNEPMLRKLVTAISKDEINGKLVKELSSKYIRVTKEDIAKLKRNCKAFKVNGYSVGIGYAKGIQSTQACGVIHEKLRTDIEVFINLNHRRLNMRSRKGIDCSPLASSFGGGGHPQASGARFRGSLSSDKEIKHCINLIIKAANSALPKRNFK